VISKRAGRYKVELGTRHLDPILFIMQNATTLSRLEDCKRVRVIQPLPQETVSVRPLSILIAEPSAGDALLLEQALFHAEMHVPTHFVNDAKETIAYLRGDPPFANRYIYPMPTLLLLDMDLPRSGSLDVLRWLRRNGLNHMLIVVLSSSSKYEEICQAYSLGADSCVIKPSDPGEVINVAAHLKNYWLEMNPQA